MNHLNEKPVCLITGGSSGIGLATAKKFAVEGFHLAICGRRKEPLEAARMAIESDGLEHQIQCLTVPADLEDSKQARGFGEAALQHFGKIDVLVNNAALAPLSAFEDISPETFESTINVNIRSIFSLTQLIWKQWKSEPNRQSGGVVVNISSQAAVDPFPDFSLYGASKAWLDLMTTALAVEGKEFGLRVYSIRPGAVETPMLRGLFPDFPPEQCVTPLRIADQIWKCVDEPQNYPSGQCISVTNQI